MSFLNDIIPNVMNNLPELYQAIIDTLFMAGISAIIAFPFGVICGVILVVSKKGNILENKVVYWIFDKLTNLFRAIPFIILIVLLRDFSRLLSGTYIGRAGAIIPLIIGTIPFLARQIESTLEELDHGLIEASESMGLSPTAIIFRVYLKESIPGLIRASSITLISVVGLTAVCGAVGAGGIGDFAIRYGLHQNFKDITYVSVIIILLMVSILQWIGSILIKKTTH